METRTRFHITGLTTQDVRRLINDLSITPLVHVGSSFFYIEGEELVITVGDNTPAARGGYQMSATPKGREIEPPQEGDWRILVSALEEVVFKKVDRSAEETEEFRVILTQEDDDNWSATYLGPADEERSEAYVLSMLIRHLTEEDIEQSVSWSDESTTALRGYFYNSTTLNTEPELTQEMLDTLPGSWFKNLLAAKLLLKRIGPGPMRTWDTAQTIVEQSDESLADA